MHKQHEHHVQPEMAWTDLWPVNAPARATGWSETLPPGLCVVVDDTGTRCDLLLPRSAWLPGVAVSGPLVRLPLEGDGVRRALEARWDRAAMQAHAEQFSEVEFSQRIRNALTNLPRIAGQR